MKNGTKIGLLTGGALVGGLLVFGVTRALATGIPATNALMYSGFLEDSAGVAVNGSRNIEVKLWDAAAGGTTPLCATNPVAVNVAAGRFSMPLPDTCTAAVKANKDTWVEVLVAAASLGRTKLGAVPYAVEAGHATSADLATSATNATTAATANAAGGGLKTTIDGLSPKADLPKITAWTSYTPSLTAGGAAVTGVNANFGSWRRVGDSIEVMISTSFDATSLSDSNYLTWHLPNGLQASRPNNTSYALGSAVTGTASSVFGACVVDTEAGSSGAVFVLCHGTDAIRRNEVGPGLKVTVLMRFTVPVSGWTLTTP